MTADSIAANLEKARLEDQQAQTQERLKILETWKTDFQNSLLTESKNFKNSIAQAETKARRLLWVALATTTLSVLLTSFLILNAERSARKLNDQAQIFLSGLHASEVLGERGLIPSGDLTNFPDGRMFIEVKKLKE